MRQMIHFQDLDPRNESPDAFESITVMHFGLDRQRIVQTPLAQLGDSVSLGHLGLLLVACPVMGICPHR